jgi:GxxExxY protein
MEELDPLTERIIGCGIAVHRALGPGLLESPYQAAMCLELTAAGLGFERERLVPLTYRGRRIGEYRPDLVVESQVLVEIKSVQQFDPVFSAQVLTYLRVTGLRRGLLLNFGRPVLKDGIKRFVL